MNPQEQVCPNPSCGASGAAGAIRIHSQAERRYGCKQCGCTFSERHGTALYRVKKAPDLFVLVVTLLAYGCPVQAIVVAFQMDERTVWAWLQRAGKHCQRVHEGEVQAASLTLGQIQADELKVHTYLGTLWVGLVMMVSTRFWLGGAVSSQRSKRLLGQVLAWAQWFGRPGSVLVAVDGLNLYLEVIPAVFTRVWDWLKAGWTGWTRVAIVQTMTQKGGRRGRIDRQIAQGDEQLVRQLIRGSQAGGWINTAFIERLNATFRLRMACLVRQGRQLVRHPETLEAWMWLVGSVYNWCTYHEALAAALTLPRQQRRWLQRTPAIATGLTDHRWAVAELLWWKRPLHHGRLHSIFRGTT